MQRKQACYIELNSRVEWKIHHFSGNFTKTIRIEQL